MDSSKSKSARFSVVVARCGEPDSLTLWTRPERDGRLMKAIKEDRVLTIRRVSGSKKDCGEVGFLKGRDSAYLIFPKPLTRFRGRKIVGIKYDLLSQSEPLGEVVPARKRSDPRSPPTPTGLEPRSRRVLEGREVPAPKARLFKVRIRFTATVETTEAVEAQSRKAARQQALRQVEMPDMRRGTVTRRVARVSYL